MFNQRITIHLCLTIKTIHLFIFPINIVSLSSFKPTLLSWLLKRETILILITIIPNYHYPTIYKKKEEIPLGSHCLKYSPLASIPHDSLFLTGGTNWAWPNITALAWGTSS